MGFSFIKILYPELFILNLHLYQCAGHQRGKMIHSTLQDNAPYKAICARGVDKMADHAR